MIGSTHTLDINIMLFIIISKPFGLFGNIILLISHYNVISSIYRISII